MSKIALGLSVVLAVSPHLHAVDRQAIPTCSAEQEAAWRHVVTSQLGVSVRDADLRRQWVGPVANMKKASGMSEGEFGGRNWFPADVFKRTACGRHEDLTVFDPAWSGKETDFHIYFKPGQGFQFLQEDVRPLGARPKFYTEITLPKGFRKYPPWFWPGPRNLLRQGKASSDVLTRGDEVCAYGPWVLEEYHDYQPEIHPSEAFWFRDAAKSSVHVFLAHDASNRFQREKYYCRVDGPRVDCREGLPAAFVAWAAPSTRHVILVPYELAIDRPDQRRLNVKVHAPEAAAPTLDAVHVEHSAGRSTLEFQRYEGVSSLSIAELSSRRCQTERAGHPVVLGYVAASVELDSEATPSRPFGHLEFSGSPTSHEYTVVGRADTSEDEPELRLEGLAFRRRDSPAIVDEADDGRRVYPEGAIAIEPRARFRVPSVNSLGREVYYDIVVSYEPATNATEPERAEALSEYLGAILTGVPFDTDPEGSAGTARHARYASLFGEGGCFVPAVVASLDGQSVPVLGCEKSPRPVGSGVSVCINRERACRFQGHKGLARVSVRYGEEARGRVTLAADVTDPFGVVAKARPVALTLPVGRQIKELDAKRTLRLDHVFSRVCLSEAGKRVLEEARVEVGHQVPRTEAREFVYLPETDAPLRRGRLFWLMAMTLSRDLELSDDEQGKLTALLAAFADSEPGLRCGSVAGAATPE